MEVTGNDGKQCTIEPGADLSQANLSGALLSGANLSGAKLIDADLNGANLVRVTYDGQTVFPVGFDPPDPSRVPSTSSSPLTGIKLLRVLAWTWIILCPIGGIVFWVVLENILGLQLFLAATLSGVVTFAVFLVLCTIAENLIAIKNVVTSNTQQSS